jgi:hypothetical protein
LVVLVRGRRGGGGVCVRGGWVADSLQTRRDRDLGETGGEGRGAQAWSNATLEAAPWEEDLCLASLGPCWALPQDHDHDHGPGEGATRASDGT